MFHSKIYEILKSIFWLEQFSKFLFILVNAVFKMQSKLVVSVMLITIIVISIGLEENSAYAQLIQFQKTTGITTDDL